ncbi:MAG: DNA polymerase III subunit epsilon [Gammaproteobacteria bacterium]|nr:DNA polymerase III subunit epsilon [Gammaproteobacteria bacterium]
MRQVILDTETTGLKPASGHRIIEIGCVELKDRRKTDRVLHYYINPEREIEDAAVEIHGITQEQLQGEPVFADIADPFIDFIRDSEVIMHNAPFDAAFIDAELSRLGDEWGRLEDYCRITDTLEMARELHPGQRNSLDALSARYQVNIERNLHGALLDAQILLDVYLAMTGGQSSLLLDEDGEQGARSGPQRPRAVTRQTSLKIVEPSQDELAAHQRMLGLIEEQVEIS